ncbi:hypothetical protein [Paractinoplanes rishiriensis]|uniref:Uncharacterized protein n=1 Tax=Paractinoplanes rishiriensis TaxID=1050105 RepID=A0A919MUG8_9ACTN|nr:hypothetical protein [Actinoplanes rishiriensis]GIE95319.1 hypothetical protein Ari01nite_27840 [Actinoplanes rishiriensis]
MRCDICGTPLDRPGQGHFCRTNGAGTSPAAQTFALAAPAAQVFAQSSSRVIRSGAVYAVLVAAGTALGLAGYTAIRSGAADPAELSTQATVVIVGLVAGFIGLICLLVLLISTVTWVISAHRLAGGGPGPAGYGGVAAFVLLTGLSYVLPGAVPGLVPSVLTEAALRIGGLLLLIAGVVAAGRRVREVTGLPTLAARPQTLIQADDWDASKWDPDVHRDIERRRRPVD